MHRGIGAVIVGIVAVALGLLAHASEVNAQSSQSSRQAEVTKCWASPPRVETGDSVTVKATVKNNSAGVFSAKLHVVFDIYPPSGGKYPFKTSTKTVHKNQSATFSENVRVHATGKYTVVCNLWWDKSDWPLDWTGEKGRTSNGSFTVVPAPTPTRTPTPTPPPQKPDLVVVKNPRIERVEPDDGPLTRFTVGDTVKIHATVANIGKGSAGSSRLGYYISKSDRNPSSEDRFDRDTVPALDPSAISNRWDPYEFTEDDVGWRYFWFVADYRREVDEASESNNRARIGPFEVVQRQPPSFRVSHSDIPQTVRAGESFTLDIRMDGVSGPGANGGISVSFPGVTAVGSGSSPNYSSSLADVSAVSYTGDHNLSRVEFYDKGDTIYNSSGAKISARYLLVETDDPRWSSTSARTLKLRVTPKRTGKFDILIRGWICADQDYSNCSRKPSRGATDQQGFAAISQTVTVESVQPPSFRVSHSDIPQTVRAGESFTLDIRMDGVSGSGANGGISVSFPGVTAVGSGSSPNYSSSLADVSAVSYTGDHNLSRVEFYDKGDTIYNSSGAKISARYLLVETDDPRWSSTSARTLKLRVTPKRTGKFDILIRGWICADQDYSNCSRKPSRGATDQQGFAAISQTVTVESVQPPSFRVSHSDIPQTVRAGESFTLDIRMDGVSGSGANGGISVSFPGVTAVGSGSSPNYSSSLADVSAVSYTGDHNLSRVEFYDKGDTIYNSSGAKISARYLLVETDDPRWSSTSARTLKLRVTPKRTGKFDILIRGWICADQDYSNCSRKPSRGATDQQGFAAISQTVTVESAPKPDQPPSFRVSHSDIPQTVRAGESFTLDIRMDGVSGSGANGGISVSFPGVTAVGSGSSPNYSSSLADVSAVSYTGDHNLSRVEFYDKGDTIYNSSGAKISARYLLVETDDPRWSSTSARTLKLRVTPKRTGKFDILIRGWICADQDYSNCSRKPSRGATDQQGFAAISQTVTVESVQPPSFRVSHSDIPQTVRAGESFTLDIRMDGVSGSGANGGISVSFPGVTAVGSGSSPNYSSSLADVSAVSYTGDHNLSRVEFYDKGDTIYNSSGAKISARYLLVETDDPRWSSTSARTLKLRVTPKRTGKFDILIRGWICADQDYSNCSRKPSRGATDQQGFAAISQTVTVESAPKPDQPPSFRVSHSDIPQTVRAGESFTLDISMHDVSGPGERGGISVSFPGVTAVGSGSSPNYSSLLADVSAVSYTDNHNLSRVEFYDKGDTIYNSSGAKISARYLLVETDDPRWSSSSARTLRLRITPKRTGKFDILIRGWICADQDYSNCSREPSRGTTDQQGYTAISQTVVVQSQPPSFRMSHSSIPQTVRAGESFTLDIRMDGVSGPGANGGVSVSFPSLTASGVSSSEYSSSQADVEVVSYTTLSSRVSLYDRGDPIYHRDGRRFGAEYLLVETDDPRWSSTSIRTLSLKITPKRAGEFDILIRGWICADQQYSNCSRDPSKGATDQQGFAAISQTVNVVVPADDHGNSRSDAADIDVGAWKPGSIETGKDVDFFSFKAEARRSYTIQTHLGTLSDTVITLYDSEGYNLGGNDDISNENRASRLERTFWSSGTYYVRVKGNGRDTGTYHLGVSRAGDTLPPPTTADHGPSFRIAPSTSGGGTIEVGKSFTLDIRMHGVSGPGANGGVSVSFPSLTASGASSSGYSSSQADVEVVGYTSGLDKVKLHQPRTDKIFHSHNNVEFNALYLLVESEDPSWLRGDDKTLKLLITPKQAGDFEILYRGWICGNEYKNCTRRPDSGNHTDQQGWHAFRGIVEVAPSDISTACVSELSGLGDINGRWASGCDSTERVGNYYARYYTFTLPDEYEVTIDLESDRHAYLYLRNGAGKTGDVIASKGDVDGQSNLSLVRTLSAGTYTIEATTFSEGVVGDFTLSVQPRIYPDLGDSFKELFLTYRFEDDLNGDYWIFAPEEYTSPQTIAEGLATRTFGGMMNKRENRVQHYRKVLREIVTQEVTRRARARAGVFLDISPVVEGGTIDFKDAENLEDIANLAYDLYQDAVLIDSVVIDAATGKNLLNRHLKGLGPKLDVVFLAERHFVNIALTAAVNRTIDIQYAYHSLDMLERALKEEMPEDDAWDKTFDLVREDIDNMTKEELINQWGRAIYENRHDILTDSVRLAMKLAVQKGASKVLATSTVKVALVKVGVTASFSNPITAALVALVGLAWWAIDTLIVKTGKFWDELTYGAVAAQAYAALHWNAIHNPLYWENRQAASERLLDYTIFSFYQHLHEAAAAAKGARDIIFNQGDNKLVDHRETILSKRDAALVNIWPTNWKPDQDFNTLHADNPIDISSDGETMWVADNYYARAYNMNTNMPTTSKDVKINNISTDEIRGIWSDGETMWAAKFYYGVGTRVPIQIQAYNINTEERNDDSNIRINEFFVYPQGIWSDGTTMWLADSSRNDKIYAYNMNTKEREQSKEFNTLKDAGNEDPHGIWSDGTTMWVADARDAKLYAYNMDTKERDESKDLFLLDIPGVVDNKAPTGIWSDGFTMWVADSDDNKIYAYTLPGGSETPASMPAQTDS